MRYTFPMVSKLIPGIIIFGIVGLVVGYLLFARQGGGFVNPIDLFLPGDDLLSQGVDWATGREQMRNNILVTGAVGAVIGAVIQVVRGGR